MSNVAITEATGSAWFAPDQQAALQDFWRVYDENFESVLAAYGRIEPEPLAGHTGATHDRLSRAIVGGEWEQYEQYLRGQAVGYARHGLTFAAWHERAAAFYRHLAPVLVDAYGESPARLCAALAAMHQFGAAVIEVLGDAYLAELAVISRATEAVAAQRAHRAEARFARLSESGVLGIIVGTLDGKIVDINDTALQILGRSRDEILSGAVHWAELTPPEWAERDGRVADQLRAEGAAPLREKEYVHADGHRVPVLMGSAMVEGVASEVISFVIDITERKLAKAALDRLRSDAKFGAVLESAPDAMVVVDHEGHVVLVNAQTEKLFGYAREELIGVSVERLIPERFRGTHAGQRGAYFQRPTVRTKSSGLQLYGLRKDGSEFPAEISLSQIETEDGILVSSAIRDISDRQATESALRLANKELEAFSYSVAHDLRAPLRGMNGFAQLLVDTYAAQFDADGRDWLNEILLNAKKMGALIDALLSLAKVTRSELHVERVDLSAVVRAAASQLAVREPLRLVEVVIAPGLTADVDPLLARALVENLVGNAWKFTGHTSGARIEFGVTASPASPAAFFVRDNGAGFDMQFAAKLFVPFQRLHTVVEFPGTGIGLATAQRIVQRHGGRIWADGTVGGGATFHFTLPGGSR